LESKLKPDADHGIHLEEAEIVEFPTGATMQSFDAEYVGIYVIGRGKILVKGDAGMGVWQGVTMDFLKYH
jgi:DNA gyrase/topoisomerase IV subunit A